MTIELGDEDNADTNSNKYHSEETKGNVENSETTNKGKNNSKNHKNNEQDNNFTHTSLTGVNMVDNANHLEQANKLDDESVNTILTGMTMQAEKSDNNHKCQDKGNLTDNSSIAGMTIGEKVT